MRTISKAARFKRDFKRESKGERRAILSTGLLDVITSLLKDIPLSEKYKDHALVGNWAGARECHVLPDLLLIYEKVGKDELWLRRLGSHSELNL